MIKTPFVCAIALLGLLGLISAGCSGKHDQAETAGWTPAKSGMSKADFFKVAAQHMRNRPSSGPQHGPPTGQGSPGSSN